MYFKDILGQDRIKQELLLQYKEGRVAHTQLFCSAKGVGAFELALAYARYLNCEHPGASDSCGVCPSCIKFNKLIHPDLHFIFPVIKAKICDDYLADWRRFVLSTPYFTLEQWLNYIQAENAQGIIYAKESESLLEKLSFKSSQGKYKTTIIWLPEKMHTVCANKLLKLFEEPPKNTIFILVSQEPELLLPTILSRTQRIDIPKLKSEEIAGYLQQNYGIDPTLSKSIAHISEGSLNKALAEIQLNEDKSLFLELFINIMRNAYAKKVKEIKAWSEQVAALGREKQKQLLTYCQYMIRENFIYNIQKPELNYMNDEEKRFSKNFSPFINERNIINIMKEFNRAQQHIEQNANAKMVFFDLALKLIVQIKQ